MIGLLHLAMTKRHRIPKFKNLEEEAVFWDTHDTTDFEHEMKPVKIKFDLSQPVSVRFDKKTLHEFKHRARTKGIGPTTLIRMW